jgi:hypothetical protein
MSLELRVYSPVVFLWWAEETRGVPVVVGGFETIVVFSRGIKETGEVTVVAESLDVMVALLSSWEAMVGGPCEMETVLISFGRLVEIVEDGSTELVTTDEVEDDGKPAGRVLPESTQLGMLWAWLSEVVEFLAAEVVESWVPDSAAADEVTGSVRLEPIEIQAWVGRRSDLIASLEQSAS